jgi:hypothetical protein
MRQVVAETVAAGWQKEGRTDRAMEFLEQVGSEDRIGAPVFWVRNQFLLADLYRKQGRAADAVRIEGQLRNLLSAADPDFPLLKQLQR